MKHTIEDSENQSAKRFETEGDNACCFGMVRIFFLIPTCLGETW